MFEAAYKYETSDLLRECIDFIGTSIIRVKNVLALMSRAHNYSIGQIIEKKTLLFIDQHAEVTEQEDWEEFVQSQPQLAVIITRYAMKFKPKTPVPP